MLSTFRISWPKSDLIDNTVHCKLAETNFELGMQVLDDY